jgi:hypothetical protein
MIINKGILKLIYLQSKIRILNSILKPSNIIKIKILLTSLKLVYKATLIVLVTSC